MNSLNHPKVKPLTRARAVELGLEPRFIDFIFRDEKPSCFRYWCKSKDSGWTCFVPESVDVAYPLWSCNADQTLLLLSKDQLSFARGYHDDPDDPDVENISLTSQGLLADLINKVYESETPVEEVRLAAESCGFRYLNEYLDFRVDLPENGDWESVWRSFIREVDERSS